MGFLRAFLLDANVFIMPSFSGESRTVRHLQYLVWPDHGVPTDFQPFIEFRRQACAIYVFIITMYHFLQVRDAVREQGECGPLVVHCSAGVGRAGSFTTVDIQLEKYANESRIDIFTGY